MTAQGQRQEGTWALLRVCWGHPGTPSSSGKGIELPPGPGRQAGQERGRRVMAALVRFQALHTTVEHCPRGLRGAQPRTRAPPRGRCSLVCRAEAPELKRHATLQSLRGRLHPAAWCRLGVGEGAPLGLRLGVWVAPLSLQGRHSALLVPLSCCYPSEQRNESQSPGCVPLSSRGYVTNLVSPGPGGDGQC